jgi:hypothetical protein
MEDWGSRDELDPRTIINVISALGTAISALVTGVLAFLTYSTLLEVQQQRQLMDAQRQLMFDQVRLANEADLTLLTPVSRNFKKSMAFIMTVQNRGGPAFDVDINIKVICCRSLQEIYDNSGTVEIIELISTSKPRVSRSSQFSLDSVDIPDEAQESIRPAAHEPVDHRSNAKIFIYATLSYMQPALTHNNESEFSSESTSYYWHSNKDRWMNLPLEHHRLIKEFIDANK